ncbi:GNAT family N-acetyltransferase [Stappia sp. F7233]|uniref:GNAT family N-acetyltransferase n=1 Tax=Stappia albiluteola TaxID=2758565 RepID=A0A839AJ51_9HYPH|nr:GNAT family protein [Stappia albiluteola]MBA5778529.1 GNAT family N-acetyltransferase [Stappia albiluteola]
MGEAGAAITLRAPEASDLKLFQNIREDAALQHQLLAYPKSPRVDDAAEWLARRQRAESTVFKVLALLDGEAVGFVQIADIHRLGGYGFLGIAVARPYWGKGYGRAGLLAILEHARTDLGLRKLMLYVRSDNEAAISLYKSADFRLIGTLSRHYFDGRQYHDVVLMERDLEGRH